MPVKDLKSLVQDPKEITETLFKQFWKLYPNKVQKKTAWDKFNKLDIETQRTIVNHVKERIQTDAKWIDGFVPMPGTFFNQHRWEDEWEPKTETAIQGRVKRKAVEQVICPTCKSDTRAQRHHDICASNVPYWDFKINGNAMRLADNDKGYVKI